MEECADNIGKACLGCRQEGEQEGKEDKEILPKFFRLEKREDQEMYMFCWIWQPSI